MKKIISLCMTMMMSAAFAAAQSDVANANLSPLEQNIAEAGKAVAEKPEDSAGYNLLAAALVRRAEEISDIALYTQAEEAVKKSLAIAPNNFDAEKIQCSILIGKHEFPAALDLAKALNKRIPDDVMVYGLLTDANVELGNYADAEDSAQWMLNLRPGNLPALIRAARLREVFGDNEGAYELWQLAYQSTPQTEMAERAGILTKMGHLRVASGATDAAEKLFQQALTSVPGYPAALGNLAQVRVSQKRYAEAVVLLQQRYRNMPRTQNLYDLAEALRLAGRNGGSKKIFADFETKALAESAGKDNSNRDLVFFYADYAHQPAKALNLAKQEYAWRHDVYTLDAYAWALHVSGHDADARKQIEIALAVGIRDSKIFEHAGEITLKLGDRDSAQKYLQEAVSLHAAGSEQVELMLGRVSAANARQ